MHHSTGVLSVEKLGNAALHFIIQKNKGDMKKLEAEKRYLNPKLGHVEHHRASFVEVELMKLELKETRWCRRGKSVEYILRKRNRFLAKLKESMKGDEDVIDQCEAKQESKVETAEYYAMDISTDNNRPTLASTSTSTSITTTDNKVRVPRR